jgi:uncharacterized membrane protein YdjX (TVP38/TMEM64 family)
VIEALAATIQAWQGSGLAGLVGLATICALGALLWVPRFTLYLLGGLVFGLAAAPAAVIGTTLGAVLALLVARYAARDWFLRRIENWPVWQATLAAIEADGWRLVALVRFASPMPGGAINYLYGLTRIGLTPYAAATCAGLVPPITAFVALGAFGRMALEELSGSWPERVAIAAGVAVLLLIILLVLRRVRASLVLSRGPDALTSRP